MRVLLVSPYNVGKFGLQNIFQAEPLGLEIIGQSISKNHDVYIQDLRWEPDLEARLASFQPDLVGISCLYVSHTRPTWEIARRVKAAHPAAFVLVGGQPPSLGSQYFASEHIDAIGLGDGEFLMPDLLHALETEARLSGVAGLILNREGSQHRTAIRPQPRDFAALSHSSRRFPGIDRSRHYMSFARPLALMEVTRGCPYRCNFCSIWKFGEAKVRSKTIDQVVSEIAALEENAVFFVDDHFFADAPLMLDLGRELASADLGKSYNIQTRTDALVKHPELAEVWKSAGLHAAFLGLEGHSPARLEEVRKACSASENERAIEILNSAGVGWVGNLMVDPAFSREDFEQLRDYVTEKNLHAASYCIATPFPGTDTWTQRYAEVTTLDFDLFDIQHAVYETRLPLEEFYREYASLWSLRAAMQPQKTRDYKATRAEEAALQDPINRQLIQNVSRFDKVVVDPKEYLADHVDAPIPWPDEALSTEGNFGDVQAEAV